MLNSGVNKYMTNSLNVTSWPRFNDSVAAFGRNDLIICLPMRVWKYRALGKSPSNLFRYAERSRSNGWRTIRNLVYSDRILSRSSVDSELNFWNLRKRQNCNYYYDACGGCSRRCMTHMPGECAIDAGIFSGSVPFAHWSVININIRFQLVHATFGT